MWRKALVDGAVKKPLSWTQTETEAEVRRQVYEQAGREAGRVQGAGCRGSWVPRSGLCPHRSSGLPLKPWGLLVREASAIQSQQH